MKALRCLLATVTLALASAALADDAVRFVAVDIYLDTAEPVAAWQFEFSDQNDRMQVVGVEGGDSRAFKRVPYYDRDAVERSQADRIVVADYSLAASDDLPRGRTRIATLHLMLKGDTEFQLELITATSSDGKVLDASSDFALQTGSE